jgi:hypothetical protein
MLIRTRLRIPNPKMCGIALNPPREQEKPKPNPTCSGSLLLTPGRGGIYIASVPPKPEFPCSIRASFAIAFKNWRCQNRLPLKQVAADLGLSIGTISKWELGQRFPTDRHMEMLCRYSGLPPCKLFCVMAEKCLPADCLIATKQRPRAPQR